MIDIAKEVKNADNDVPTTKEMVERAQVLAAIVGLAGTVASYMAFRKLIKKPKH